MITSLLESKPYYKALFIVMVCILLRHFFSFFIDPSEIGDITSRGDQVFYLEGAKSLFETGSYSIGSRPTFYRAPLYSYVISFLYSSNSFVWARNIYWLQASFNVFSSLLFCLSISRVFSSRISLLWLALWLWTPFSFIQDRLVLQESLYTSLLIAIVSVCLLSGHASRILSLYILPTILGLLLGLVSLTREVYAVYPFLLFPPLAYHLSWRSLLKLRSLLLAATVMLFTLFPWIHRNYILSSEGPFISKGVMGLSLYYGTWVEGGGTNWQQKWLHGVDLPPAAFSLTSFDNQYVQRAVDSRSDSQLKQIAIDSIFRHPLTVFKNWLRRFPSMWVGTRSDLILLIPVVGSPLWTIIKSSLYLLNLAILLPGLIYILSKLKELDSSLLVLASLPLFNFLIYLPFLNIETRYSHPSVPVFMLFAILFYSAIVKKIYNHLSKPIRSLPLQ